MILTTNLLRNMMALAVILVLSIAANGQHDSDRHEKIKQLKVAYFSETLSLSIEEAQQFWPVYNRFESRRHQLDRESRKVFSDLPEENVSERDLLERVERRRQLQNELNDDFAVFLKEVMAIIGPVRTAKMLQAETDFRRNMKKEWMERRQRERPNRK